MPKNDNFLQTACYIGCEMPHKSTVMFFDRISASNGDFWGFGPKPCKEIRQTSLSLNAEAGRASTAVYVGS